MAQQRKLSAIMFTDIHDFTRRMNEREALALEQLRVHNGTLDELCKRYGGKVVKSLGDSYLIDFSSAVNAVLCALQAQKTFAEYSAPRSERDKLLVRVSIHLGDVVATDNDVYGDGVNVASRLQSVTPPGGICVSREVQAQIQGKLDCRLVALGPHRLKGVAAPVDVFRVEAADSPEAAPADADPMIGRTVGPCRIEAALGRGGMGSVYRARHLRLDRPVAVKILAPPSEGGYAAAEMFLQEARTAARLEDPRIVQVFDVGQEDGLRYIVMQLCTGQTLEQRVARAGPLPQPEALRLMKEVLRALAAAHSQGIVHRDVKPSNIMIEDSGAVKLMDFGIAESSARETRAFELPGSSMGSIDFMAPERAFESRPDPRMDLYSFGATYYFALTGSPPYTGRTASEVLLKHREAAIPDVREFNREVAPGAARLLARLMAKDPRARPAGAEEVLKLLDGADMLLDVDVSGSPFKILPPPVEPKVGLAAEVAAVTGVEPAAPEREPAPPPPLPPPPPALSEVPQGITPAGAVIFSVLYAVFFGLPWTRAVHADWLGAGAAAAATAALVMRGSSRTALRSVLAAALFAAMAYSFFRFGGAPGTQASPEWPSLELEILAGLGLAAGLAALYLGLAASGEGGLSGALLGASAAALLAAAIRGIAGETSWFDGARAYLAQEWGSLTASGGLWRWGGLPVLYGAYGVLKLSGSLKQVASPGKAEKIVRFNR